jgi:hypothetical protein
VTSFEFLVCEYKVCILPVGLVQRFFEPAGRHIRHEYDFSVAHACFYRGIYDVQVVSLLEGVHPVILSQELAVVYQVMVSYDRPCLSTFSETDQPFRCDVERGSVEPLMVVQYVAKHNDVSRFVFGQVGIQFVDERSNFFEIAELKMRVPDD